MMIRIKKMRIKIMKINSVLNYTLKTSIATFFLVNLFFSSLNAAASKKGDVIDVWVGTSSSKLSKGIYRSQLNVTTGKLSAPELAAEVTGPGFLAMHPSGDHLYAVANYKGQPSVLCYSIMKSGQKAGDKTTLDLVNSMAIGDGGAAHVSIDTTGRTLLTAQYGGGSVAAFSLKEDGSLKARTQLIEHEGGSGVVAGRQKSPHPHWTGFSPDERFAFVPDLGLDKVMIYRVDHETTRLTPNGFAKSPAGGGPRHMKFHTTGQWVYVLNELSLSVTVFDYNLALGVMTPKQTIPTVPENLLQKEKFNSASEIRVHPSGQFVYSANRGHDTITAFRVDQKSGELEVIEMEPIRGSTPRNFNIDPSGRWLLVAGQDSHTLAVFEIDSDTGELTYHRSSVFVPSPICVLFEHE
jgi:6-phosphogluconolactonase